MLSARGAIAYLIVAQYYVEICAGGSESEVMSSTERVSQKKWIGELFLDAERDFNMNQPAVTQQCTQDFHTYQMFFRNQTLWAIRMYESSEWPGIGIFSGNRYRPGNWEECLHISSANIKGKFCRLDAVYSFGENNASAYGDSVQMFPEEDASIWDSVSMYRKNPIRLGRHELFWSMCIPASCSHADLELSMNNLLTPMFRDNDMNISVRVNPVMCSETKGSSYSTGFYLTSFAFVLLISLTLISGLYDVFHDRIEDAGTPDENKSTLQHFIADTSIVRNCKKLFDVSGNQEASIIHCGKVFLMLCVILGHQLKYISNTMPFYVESSENLFYPPFFLSTLNVVDNFLAHTGFLTFYCGYRHMKEMGGVYCLISFVGRWLRLAPLLLCLELFMVNIFPYIGDGPLWQFFASKEVTNCKQSFWPSFVFLQNYIEPEKQCLVVTWYTAVDMQLNIIGSILLYFIVKKEKLGIGLVVLTFLAGGVSTFVMVYLHQFNAVSKTYISYLMEPRNDDEFNYFYIAAYPRITSYLTGFITAYILMKMKENKFKFSRMQAAVWLFLGTVSVYIVVSYSHGFFRLEKKFNIFENAFFATVNRPLFILLGSVLVLLDITTGMGSLSKIFKSKIFIPLSRLSYSVFLTHTVNQLTYAASQKTTFDSSMQMNIMNLLISDVVLSYLIGFLVFLFIEVPVYNVTKRFLTAIFSSNGRIENKTPVHDVTDIEKKPTNVLQCHEHQSGKGNGAFNYDEKYYNDKL